LAREGERGNGKRRRSETGKTDTEGVKRKKGEIITNTPICIQATHQLETSPCRGRNESLRWPHRTHKKSLRVIKRGQSHREQRRGVCDIQVRFSPEV